MVVLPYSSQVNKLVGLIIWSVQVQFIFFQCFSNSLNRRTRLMYICIMCRHVISHGNQHLVLRLTLLNRFHSFGMILQLIYLRHFLWSNYFEFFWLNLPAGTGNSSILRGKHTVFAMPKWERTAYFPRKCCIHSSSQTSFHSFLVLELGKKTELFTVHVTNSKHNSVVNMIWYM